MLVWVLPPFLLKWLLWCLLCVVLLSWWVGKVSDMERAAVLTGSSRVRSLGKVNLDGRVVVFVWKALAVLWTDTRPRSEAEQLSS